MIKKHKHNNTVFWLIGLGSLIIIGFVLWKNFNYANSLSIAQRGLFGDMFGASNALFTGLSFTGLIITILLQRQELKETRDEFITQNETLRIQRFENTFFQMLSLLSSIIENTEITVDKYKILKSRKVFNRLAFELAEVIDSTKRSKEIIERTILENFSSTEESFKEKDLIDAYGKLFSSYNDILGHYFRTLYHIIKLIDETEDIDKKRYVSIARSQLSNSELTLLFYNGIHPNGSEKFKALIQNYALLHNADLSFLPSEKLRDVYLKSAYGIS